jgi:hypothetical protein
MGGQLIQILLGMKRWKLGNPYKKLNSLLAAPPILKVTHLSFPVK